MPFLPQFADIAIPFTDLTKGGKTARIQFNGDSRAAFNKLKDVLCECAVLSTPRLDRPFHVQCDASEYAVGACLSQFDDDNRERPLAFVSAKLSDTQRRWSTLEKEAYAVVHALKQLDHIVFGGEIHIYTDHDPLQYIINNSPKCMKLTRWALHLSRYDLKVHYKAGKTNINADCLSRLI